ncbi:hypothetical protein QJQ45_011165 [Haematococcus lacustris]|nr:hypothetical protein QJQ45_011165 [Haematococcus lacustris]
MACRPLAASRRPLATKALFQSRTNVKTTKQAAAAPKPKKEEEAVVETRDSMMSQVVQALDFSQPRSRKDADLLWETKQNWKKDKALRRKIGGTYKDYFKEYVEEERVENTYYKPSDSTGTVPYLPLLVGVLLAMLGTTVYVSTPNEHKCKPKRQRADTTADAAAAAAAAELPFQRIAKCWNGQTAAQVQAAVALEVTRLQVCCWKDDKVAMAAALFPPGPPNAAGEMVVEAVAARRHFWRRAANNFPLLAAAACKLLAVHVTSAASERNWSAWGRLYTAARNASLSSSRPQTPYFRCPCQDVNARVFDSIYM